MLTKRENDKRLEHFRRFGNLQARQFTDSIMSDAYSYFSDTAKGSYVANQIDSDYKHPRSVANHLGISKEEVVDTYLNQKKNRQ